MPNMEDTVEESAKISYYPQDIISSDTPVFYNPLMKKNRDISILLLKVLGKKGMIVADPLAGSGIRTIRFLKELPEDAIRKAYINDYSEESVALIAENLKTNVLLSDERIKLTKHEANVFVMGTRGFDYIDIDPFGSPNPFLDSTMKKIARDGIIAVTSTDTAPLAGTYPKACRRKYWAEPKLDANKHETGLRILIRKVQLIGAQYDKALIPVYSYFADHYFRIFFIAKKGKKLVDEMLRSHEMVGSKGPLWTGRLWDPDIASEIAKANTFPYIQKMLDIIASESRIDSVGFHCMHEIAKKHSLKLIRHEEIMQMIRANGQAVSFTHFSPTGLRTAMEEHDIAALLKGEVQF